MGTRQADYQALRERHVPRGPSHATPSFVKEARGAVMVDLDGRELIDFAGGIGVVNVGHAHPKVVKAIQEQAARYIHTCFHIAMYEPYVDLAARLNELSPGDFHKKTLFLNSGAEAVENAVKVARHATKRPALVVLQNAFHGRTLLTMSMTSKVKPYKHGFGPFAPEVYRMPNAYCYRCPLGLQRPSCNTACADQLEDFFVGNVAADQVAAVVAEPIQGEGGFITPPPDYFQKLQAICRKNGILLVIDEVQTAMGRTGKLFAIVHWGVAPDLLLTAKSLAGGLPLSAVTGRAELMDAPHVGGLGGTFSGNPLACRAGLAVLEILLEDGLLARAEVLGEKIRARFEALQRRHRLVGDVRGKGPMMALELVKDRETKAPAAEETRRLVQRCYEKGLVLVSCGNFGNVVRTLMPLVITDEQLDRGIAILDEVLGELEAVGERRPVAEAAR